METTNPTLSPVWGQNKSVAQILEDAALYLDTYGWCQGNFTEEVAGNLPRACALGAIDAVSDGNEGRGWQTMPDARSSFMQAVGYLADFLDDGIWRDDETPSEVVWAFNDHPDSTQYLITHALRAAAKRARIELNQQAVA